MEASQNALLSCGLHELNTIGVRHTWSKKRSDKTYTKEKLDRTLATREALSDLLGSYCEVVPAIKSNHSPLVLTLCKEAAPNCQKTYIFIYEAAWELKENCSRIISKSWNTSHYVIHSRLTSRKMEETH